MMIIFNRIINYLLKVYYFFLYKNCFKHIGKHVIICKPRLIEGMHSIVIHDGAKICDGVWLASMAMTGENPVLHIGKNARIGHYNHIYCTSSIIIENDVLTADKVYISDNAHCYEDISTPIWKQPIRQLATVTIGEGSWLGENVCVLGASIGKHCVIGANSVVTKDIPDYCVAVGTPARIIKKYNHDTQKWDAVK